MTCIECGSAAVTERPERTAQGYKRFRCRACGKQFNERSGTVLNRAQYPSDIIALVVLWRLRYKLSLRDLPERRCQVEGRGTELALRADTAEIPDQQHADHQLRIDRGPPNQAVVGRHDTADEGGVEQGVHSAPGVISRHMVLEPEGVEQRLRYHSLAHHRCLHCTAEASESRPPASWQRQSPGLFQQHRPISAEAAGSRSTMQAAPCSTRSAADTVAAPGGRWTLQTDAGSLAGMSAERHQHEVEGRAPFGLPVAHRLERRDQRGLHAEHRIGLDPRIIAHKGVRDEPLVARRGD